MSSPSRRELAVVLLVAAVQLVNGGALVGMEHVAFIAIALTLTVPAFLFAVELAVRRRAAPPLVSVPELQ